MSTATRRRRPATFRCHRCKCSFGYGPTCQECGVGRGRKVKRKPGRRGVAHKRGRNSGKVKAHGKKG
ncbi:MAG TPA: hypothetical protein VF245_12665 [Solirubrobacterales bacterium]